MTLAQADQILDRGEIIRLFRGVVDQKSPDQIELIPAKGKTVVNYSTEHTHTILINVLKEFFDEKSSTN